MKKVIPLTTEIAIRQHTRRIFLENIKRILENAADSKDAASKNRIDVSGVNTQTGFSSARADPFLPISTSQSYLSDLISTFLGNVPELMGIGDEEISDLTKANVGKWALVASQPGKGYLGECLSWLDDIVTFPIDSIEFSKIYAFWAAFIEMDDDSLTMTRHLMGLYAYRNESFGEFIADTLNPADPFNLAMYALAPFTGGVTLLGLGVRKAGKEVAEETGELLIKSAAKKKARDEALAAAEEAALDAMEKKVRNKAREKVAKTVSKINPDTQVDEFFEEILDQVRSAGEKKWYRRRLKSLFMKRLPPKLDLTDLPASWGKKLQANLKDMFSGDSLEKMAKEAASPKEMQDLMIKKLTKKGKITPELKSQYRKILTFIFDNPKISNAIKVNHAILNPETRLAKGRLRKIADSFNRFAGSMSGAYGRPLIKGDAYTKALYGLGLDEKAARMMSKEVKEGVKYTAERQIKLQADALKAVSEVQSLKAGDQLKKLKNDIRLSDAVELPDDGGLMSRLSLAEVDELVTAYTKGFDAQDPAEFMKNALENRVKAFGSIRSIDDGTAALFDQALVVGVLKNPENAFKPINNSIKDSIEGLVSKSKDDLKKYLDELEGGIIPDDLINAETKRYADDLADLGDDQIKNVLEKQRDVLKHSIRSEVDRIEIFEKLAANPNLKNFQIGDGFDSAQLASLKNEMLEVVGGDALNRDGFMLTWLRLEAAQAFATATSDFYFSLGAADRVVDAEGQPLSTRELEVRGATEASKADEEKRRKLQELEKAVLEGADAVAVYYENEKKEIEAAKIAIEAGSDSAEGIESTEPTPGQFLKDLEDEYQAANNAELKGIFSALEYYDRAVKGVTNAFKTGHIDKHMQLADYLLDRGSRAETYRDINKINFIDMWGIINSGKPAFGGSFTPTQLDNLIALLSEVLRQINNDDNMKKSAVEGVLNLDNSNILPGIFAPDVHAPRIKNTIAGMKDAYPLNKVNKEKYMKNWRLLSSAKHTRNTIRDAQDAIKYLTPAVEELKKPPKAITPKAIKLNSKQKAWMEKRAKARRERENQKNEAIMTRSGNELYEIKERALRELIRSNIKSSIKKKSPLILENNKKINDKDTYIKFVASCFGQADRVGYWNENDLNRPGDGQNLKALGQAVYDHGSAPKEGALKNLIEHPVGAVFGIYDKFILSAYIKEFAWADNTANTISIKQDIKYAEFLVCVHANETITMKQTVSPTSLCGASGGITTLSIIGPNYASELFQNTSDRTGKVMLTFIPSKNWDTLTDTGMYMSVAKERRLFEHYPTHKAQGIIEDRGTDFDQKVYNAYQSAFTNSISAEDAKVKYGEAYVNYRMNSKLEFNSSISSETIDEGKVYFPLSIVFNTENVDQQSQYDFIKDITNLGELAKIKAVNKFAPTEGSNGYCIDHGDISKAPGSITGPDGVGGGSINWGGDRPYVFIPHITTAGKQNSSFGNDIFKKAVAASKGFDIPSIMKRRIQLTEFEDEVETDNDDEKKKEDKKKKKKPEKTPAQIRKELGNELRKFAAGNNQDVVPGSPGVGSGRLNTVILDKSLAYYCYVNSKEESIAKKNAPAFYGGMWSSGIAKNDQINGRIENVDELIRLMNAITVDAWNNKKGIFADDAYRAAVKGELGGDPKSWPKHWVRKSNKPGLGQRLSNIPGLEAYNSSGDTSGYSAALFFKDLANNAKKPSGNPLGSSSGKSKASAKTTPPVPKLEKIPSEKVDKNKNKFIIIDRPVKSPLYKFISKEAIEEILTRATPTKTVADFNTKAQVTLHFSGGKLSKVKTGGNIGAVITTDDYLFNKLISDFKKNVKSDISAEIIDQKEAIKAAKIKKVTLTIMNFSGRRRIYKLKESKNLKRTIRVSKAFKK